MQHNPNRLKQFGFLCLAIAGSAIAASPAQAKLQPTRQFAAVESGDVEWVTDAPVAAVAPQPQQVVVREAALRPRNIIVVDNGASAVPAQYAQSQYAPAQYAAPPAAAPVSDAPSSSRLSQIIDTKLEASRRRHEEEARRRQREDEDRLIRRFESAMMDDAAAAQPAPAPQVQVTPVIVQERVYPTARQAVVAEQVVESSQANALDQGPRHNSVTFSPAIGAGWLSSDFYEIGMGAVLGANLEYAVDDNIVINGGYTYTKYEIGIPTTSLASSAYTSFYSNYGPSFFNNNLNKLDYKQNVIDLGMRYVFFDRRQTFRPFLGGGLGYMWGILNYTPQAQTTFASNPFQLTDGTYNNYTLTGWSAYIQMGFRLQFSETFSLGAQYRFHYLISATQNNYLNNYGFINNGYNQQVAPEKSAVGGTLKDSNWQQLTLSLNFTF